MRSTESRPGEPALALRGPLRPRHGRATVAWAGRLPLLPDRRRRAARRVARGRYAWPRQRNPRRPAPPTLRPRCLATSTSGLLG
ncbi:hypothetical protein SGPA1_40234 [Streptomyces misionensis JCM 4497]